MNKKVYINPRYEQNYVVVVPDGPFDVAYDVYRSNTLYATGIKNLENATDMCNL